MEKFELKSVLGVVTGVFLYLYSSISEVIVVLFLLMVMDYLSGLAVAFRQGTFHPSEGMWGAIKKAMYAVVITCGFLADFIVNYLIKYTNVPFKSPGLVGLAVTLYLIANEGLSIFRNLIKLGIPVPDFLNGVFGYIKDESVKLGKCPKKRTKGRGV